MVQPIISAHSEVVARKVTAALTGALSGRDGGRPDDETGAHMRRVGRYSRLFTELALVDQRLKGQFKPAKEGWADFEDWLPVVMFYAGTLHDLGKLSVALNVLNKDRPLNDQEFAEVKAHCLIGYNLLKKIKLFDVAMLDEILAEVALFHHMRWYDKYTRKKSYPEDYKRARTDIPFEARIVSLADSFDVMTRGRNYQSLRPFNLALHEVRKNSRTQFDPDLVDLLVNNQTSFLNIYYRRDI